MLDLEKRKIVFLSADPNDCERTYWEDEYNVIEEIVSSRRLTNNYDLKCHPKTTQENFYKRVRGNIWLLHFCGHGTNNRLILETPDGKGLQVRNKSIINYLVDIKGLKCVIFSACNSDSFAEKIQDIVDYSIGFTGTVYSKDTTEFFKVFYESFADFETIPMAFRAVYKKLALENNEKIKVVFKCRNSIIMKVIETGKMPENWQLLQNEALKEKFQDDLNQIDEKLKVFKQKVKSKQITVQDVFLKLLPSCPSTSINGILWFEENKELLAIKLADKILEEEDKRQKRYFAEDLSMLFIALSISLVTLEEKMVQKDFVQYLRFPIEQYIYALKELPHLVPDELKSDFSAYFRDNIKHVKSLLIS